MLLRRFAVIFRGKLQPDFHGFFPDLWSVLPWKWPVSIPQFQTASVRPGFTLGAWNLVLQRCLKLLKCEKGWKRSQTMDLLHTFTNPTLERSRKHNKNSKTTRTSSLSTSSGQAKASTDSKDGMGFDQQFAMVFPWAIYRNRWFSQLETSIYGWDFPWQTVK